MIEALLTDAAVLGGLGFLLVTVVLYVLAEAYRQAVERHDLAVQAAAKRREYDDAVAERREKAETGGRAVAGRIMPAVVVEEPLRQAA